MTLRHAISWRRFRLSTLFIAVTMIGMWLAVKFHREPLTKENLSRLQQRQRIDIDVVRVVWSANGNRVAFVGWEKPVEIRDSVTMWKLSTIGEDKKIIDFAFSPDENVVAYCENGTSAEILDIRTGELTVLEAVNKQPDVVFSPDGKLLATGGYGDTARLWDVRTGKMRTELYVGPTVGGLRPVFSEDGKLLAIGNRNSTTHIFDVETGEQVQILPRRSSQELMFHPNGSTIAVAYVDAKIGLWNVKSGELLHLADTTAEEIYVLDWSPNGQILASAGLKGDINLWNGSDLSPLHTLPAPEWVISVRFRPDMRGIVTAGGSRMPGGQRFVQEWEVPSFVKSRLGGM
jgi:WD40 repeat protein